MSMKPFIAIVGLVGLAMLWALGVTSAAVAQPAPVAQSSGPQSPAPARQRRRIVITPQRLLYRRCVDWYELQHRPNGTVLFPQTRCWWVHR